MLSWLRLHAVVVAFVVAGVVAGPILALETPPFAVPDEHLHFYESCRISMGHVLPGHDGPLHRLTIELPVGLVDFGRDFLEHKERKLSLPFLAAADAHPLRAYDVQRFLVLNETRDWGFYPPVQYAPQALGCGLARALDLRPALVLVFVRFANLLSYLVVGALALRAMQHAREAMLLLLLAPMSLAMAASASGDGALLSFLALWLALVTRTDVAKPLRTWHVAGYALFAFCLAMSKVIYAPLTASFLLVPSERFRSTRARVAAVAVVGIASALGAVAWLPETGQQIMAFATSPKHTPLDVIATAFLHQPLATLRMWANTLVSERIVTGFAGNLGLRDVPLPSFCYWLFYPALLVAMVGGGRVAPTARVRRGGALLIGLALVVTCALFTFYMAWVDMTAVDERVRSLQGRHLLPIAMALATGASMMCTTARFARARAVALPVVAVVVAVTLLAQVPGRLRDRYYAPHDAVAAALLPFRTPPPIRSIDRMDWDP